MLWRNSRTALWSQSKGLSSPVSALQWLAAHVNVAKRKRRGMKHWGGEYVVILHQFGASCLRASWARGVVFILEQISEEFPSPYSALFYSGATCCVMNHTRKSQSPTPFPPWTVPVCVVLPQMAAVLHLQSFLSPCSFALSLIYM